VLEDHRILPGRKLCRCAARGRLAGCRLAERRSVQPVGGPGRERRVTASPPRSIDADDLEERIGHLLVVAVVFVGDSVLDGPLGPDPVRLEPGGARHG
jgi:hypothetical protein